MPNLVVKKGSGLASCLTLFSCRAELCQQSSLIISRHGSTTLKAQKQSSDPSLAEGVLQIPISSLRDICGHFLPQLDNVCLFIIIRLLALQSNLSCQYTITDLYLNDCVDILAHSVVLISI